MSEKEIQSFCFECGRILTKKGILCQECGRRIFEKKVGEECPIDCKQFPNEKTCWANPICKKKAEK